VQSYIHIMYICVASSRVSENKRGREGERARGKESRKGNFGVGEGGESLKEKGKKERRRNLLQT
jgi:hypothetical protein